MKRGFGQIIASAAVFAIILLALVSVDTRVRDKVHDLWAGGDGLTPWGHRASDLGGALADAIRNQSIENAPLLIFAAVGAVLFVFMVKA